jgi:hypothetical protein
MSINNPMLRSLLLSSPLPIPLQGPAQNPINGSDAESYALAKIVLACRGEGHWGSREEDCSKIDLFFSVEHPWYESERLIIFTQVKSGKSFGSTLSHGFKLKARAKNAAVRTTHPVCVAWVDRDKNRVFWAYVHPTTTATDQEYGAYHEVGPPMIYDLARCAAVKREGITGGRGIIIRKRDADITARRKCVKAIYQGFDKVISPAVGQIELTRFGWRHMLRNSRSANNKASSIDLIPYLKKILEQFPSSHAITQHQTLEVKDYLYRVCEHLLKFDQVRIQQSRASATTPVVAHIRLVEEIRYPRNWETNAMLSQHVARRVVLRSAYWKKEIG